MLLIGHKHKRKKLIATLVKFDRKIRACAIICGYLAGLILMHVLALYEIRRSS
jgi:hypothetical protein